MNSNGASAGADRVVSLRMAPEEMLAPAEVRGPGISIICGPTGAGKSAIALALAERHGLTIVSADSRQMYRGFDIGTAKPSEAELTCVPHRGIDVADPTERWSAPRWADDATRWIAEAGADKTLVVGGTGFYLRALVTPLFQAPPLDPLRRAQLSAVLGTLPTEELRRWVETLDPLRAPLGRVQLVRALEIALLTGYRVSDLHREAPARPTWPARWLLVDPGVRLAARIAARLDAMLAGGWIDEVRALVRHVPADAPAWQACGYEALWEYTAGTRDLASARDAILIGTRQYAKRQRTWFRHQLTGASVTRVDPHDPECGARVEGWWSGGGFA